MSKSLLELFGHLMKISEVVSDLQGYRKSSIPSHQFIFYLDLEQS